MIKKINIITLAIVGLLLLSSTIFYGLYLTPQKRAAAHLEYIHRAIDEVHPAVLDKKAIEFRYWHIQGYEEAKKLLTLVKTGGDANAILRFYLNGYEDSHLGGNYFQTPYDLIDSSKSVWTGWTINATHTGYFVQLEAWRSISTEKCTIVKLRSNTY